MDEQFQFDREKFKDVVHHVVDRVSRLHGSSALGNTKLHKILYYVDLLNYLYKGGPLTGEEYLRQKFGPTARHLSKCLRELSNEQRVTVQYKDYFGYQKHEYTCLRAPNMTGRLAEIDFELIDHICDFVCVRSAVEISEFSHDEVWKSVSMGQPIPYYAGFAFFPAEITEEDIEQAVNEAVRIAPNIEEERRAGSIL